ncbi:hypothetical protein VB715_10405 [Crocosphaera sp. UHCC 0190]|uniref:hypothetical protein n=1 Tax=Crocosphaera sp. UHCC 0190 TaxID=3110246 RepID=UPI002B2165B6|nr:hypothetical protein [Crocosphaera sp. UHCC 0190]MEA5510173.1 hypothetical protein [Crocosphaera sp. UHCC 0190]
MMMIIDASQPSVKPQKAVIFIPGFKYHGLSNFLLDKTQKESRFFQAYRESTQDNLQIKQVGLTSCVLDIYEVDWTEDIPQVSSNNLQKLFLNILSQNVLKIELNSIKIINLVLIVGLITGQNLIGIVLKFH